MVLLLDDCDGDGGGVDDVWWDGDVPPSTTPPAVRETRYEVEDGPMTGLVAVDDWTMYALVHPQPVASRPRFLDGGLHPRGNVPWLFQMASTMSVRTQT